MKQLFQENEKINRILKLFFENPTGSFHLREIAHLTGVSPATVSRKLKILVSSKFLKVVRSKPIFEVKANLDLREFVEAKKNHNIKVLIESGILDFLIQKYNHPEAIILYGGYAKGEDIEKSDVDIAIITSKKLAPPLEKFEKELKRRIHLLEINYDEIKPTLMNNLANGVILFGYLKVK